MDFDTIDGVFKSLLPYLECVAHNLGVNVPDVDEPSAMADWGWTTLRQLIESETHHDVETLADFYFFACSLKKFRFGGDPKKREESAISGFVERNDLCKAFKPPLYILAKAKALLAKALPEPPSCVFVDGRFGPGQVFESKMSQVSRWNHLYREFPDFISDPENLFSESARRTADLPEGVCRLRAVPKTYKKDRLITVEPYVNSFLQQWTRNLILSSIHMGPLAGTIMDQFQGECSLTTASGLRAPWFSETANNIRREFGLPARCRVDSRYIEPKYKVRNTCADRQAAKAVRASGTGEFATLDLEAASDHIPAEVVFDIFPSWLIPYLERCRTQYYQSGESEPKPVYMYAGMGNATTFVVETLYFWSIIVATQQYLGNQVCGTRVNPYDTTVYGDDIIVKTSVAASPWFRRLLAECGLIIGDDKSSWSSTRCFREACGAIGANGVRLPAQIWSYGGTGVMAPFAIADYLNRLIRTRGYRLLYAVDLLNKERSIPVYKQQRYFDEVPQSDFVLDPTWAFDEERYTLPETRANRAFQTEEWKVKIPELVCDKRIPASSITPGELKGVLSGHLRPSRRGRKSQSFEIPGREIRIREVWI